jgi:hypothetical protein
MRGAVEHPRQQSCGKAFRVISADHATKNIRVFRKAIDPNSVPLTSAGHMLN